VWTLPLFSFSRNARKPSTGDSVSFKMQKRRMVRGQFRLFHLKNKRFTQSFFMFSPFLYRAFFLCSRFTTLGFTNSRRARSSRIRFVRSNFFLKRFKARSMLSPSLTGIESMVFLLGCKFTALDLKFKTIAKNQSSFKISREMTNF